MSETYLSRGLDYYKVTMGQLEYEFQPDAEVTFELRNRSANKLSDYVDPQELTERLSQLQHGWQPEEIAYLAGLHNQDGTAQFSEGYLDFLADNPLPPVAVTMSQDEDIAVSTTGKWPLVTFWETVVMSELNEMYFDNKLAAEGSSLKNLYAEGDARLTEKIELLKDRPDIKFSDFGTRRRFSYTWHKHVIERLARECPDNFTGTSNIYLAYELGLSPIGTFAHELPMVYAALSDQAGQDPLEGHNDVFRDWRELYHNDLSTALTDTFTSEFFFSDFTDEQARDWKALRHDSGDPFEFGDQVLQFYESRGIDPTEKTIVFSDGLDIAMIIQLADYFCGKVGITFGWGTSLTNDLGVKANNFVMKATRVNDVGTVKLSDAETKHTGSVENIDRYLEAVQRRVGAQALVGAAS